MCRGTNVRVFTTMTEAAMGSAPLDLLPNQGCAVGTQNQGCAVGTQNQGCAVGTQNQGCAFGTQNQGCAVGTQNLRLRLLHKSSICINNGKPIRRFITTA
jgi:hypothetical protein